MFMNLEKVLNWLPSRNPSILCIDINSDSVKLLVIRKTHRTYQVLGYAIAPLPYDTQSETVQTTPFSVSKAILEGLQQIKSKHHFATTCVSGSSIIAKILQIDSHLSIAEQEENILVCAKQYVPYSLDDISYDYEIQGINSQNPKLLDVLFVASRRENISLKSQALLNAGITANIIDVDIYALKNACSLLPEYTKRSLLNEIIGIFNFGDINSIFIVTQNHQILYSREQEFGGKQLIIALQTVYQCSYDQATKLKNNLHKDEQNLILADFFTAVSDQIEHNLQLFNSTTIHSSVLNCVFIAGENASLPNLSNTLESHLKLPIYICNPFTEMEIESSINTDDLNKLAPKFLIACGLAVRSFT